MAETKKKKRNNGAGMSYAGVSSAASSAAKLGKSQDGFDELPGGAESSASVSLESGTDRKQSLAESRPVGWGEPNRSALILSELAGVKQQLSELTGLKEQLSQIMHSQVVMQDSLRLVSVLPTIRPPPVTQVKLDPQVKEKETEKTKDITVDSEPLINEESESEGDDFDESAPADRFQKETLLDTLKRAQKIEEKNRQRKEERKRGSRFWLQWEYEQLDKQDARRVMLDCFETLMGVVITLNALYIGLAMDMEDSSEPIWLVINFTFSGIFCLELLLKLRWLGVKTYCSNAANRFDATLIGIDCLQLLLDVVAPDAKNQTELPSASLFRIVRLIKLTRLLRLLRAEVFKDLLAMVSGMLSGVSTLGWAMIMFWLVVYVIALLFRETFGNREVENVKEYFEDVPRSIFTTFRCSFGDCSTRGGVPIFEYVYEEYNGLYTFLYCMFVFFTVVGLFNVVSAIFVESTMAAAARIFHDKSRTKRNDMNLWSVGIGKIIRRLLHQTRSHRGEEVPVSLVDCYGEIEQLDVEREVIDNLVKDEEVVQALLQLDIDPDDNEFLSDILDPDSGGTITVEDIVNGVARLRGDPRRSDIIRVDLMIRSLEKQIHHVHHAVALLEQAVSKDKGMGHTHTHGMGHNHSHPKHPVAHNGSHKPSISKAESLG